MMKIKVPIENNDIRTTIRSQLYKDIFLIVVVRIITFIPSYLYGYYTPPINVKNIIFIEAICILPFFKTRFWHWFTTSRAFEGEIVSIRHKAGKRYVGSSTIFYDKSTARASRKQSLYLSSAVFEPIDIQRIKIRLTNGRIKRVKYVYTVNDKHPIYEVGDLVRRYYGTSFMLKLASNKYDRHMWDDETAVHRICVMCGTTNLPDKRECDCCGMSLIIT